MSYLIKITGYDEETKQEVYSHSYYQTSEEYNEILRRLNIVLSNYAQERHPEWFPLIPLDKQQTQSAPVHEHIHDWRTFTNMAGTKEARLCRICGRWQE